MRKLLSQAYLLSSLQSATWTTNTTVSRGLASLTCSTISKLGIFLRPWQVSKAASSEQRMGTQNHTSFFFGKWSRVSKYLPAAMPITPSAFFFFLWNHHHHHEGYFPCSAYIWPIFTVNLEWSNLTITYSATKYTRVLTSTCQQSSAMLLLQPYPKIPPSTLWKLIISAPRYRNRRENLHHPLSCVCLPTLMYGCMHTHPCTGTEIKR